MKRLSVYLLISVFAGYCIGIASYRFTAKGSRGLSSAPSSINDYAVLPCMSDSAYRAYAKELNLEVPATGDLCADKYHGKLSRLFAMAQNLNFSFPPDWAPEIQDDFKRPLEYLKKYDQSLGIDVEGTESSVVAYNTSDDKKTKGRARAVYLGGHFFKDEPLGAWNTLVHESRHSSKSDPGHTFCRMGDIPRAAGGCDQELSIKEGRAGAYSYGSIHDAGWSLFADGLSEADREYLKSSSLAEISTRFNVLPTELAERYDLITGLSKEGEVVVVHPFFPTIASAAQKFPEKIKRIDLYVNTGGVLAYSESDKIYEWGLWRAAKLALESKLPKGYTVLEYARIFNGEGMSPYPYATFLRENNKIEYLEFNGAKETWVIKPYPAHPLYQETNNGEISHKSFFTGMFIQPFFLSNDGILYRRFRWGQEPPFVTMEGPNVRFVSANGGVASEGLFAVGNDGRLYVGNAFDVDEGDSSYQEYRIKLSETIIRKPIVKFLEGIDLRAALDKDGALHVGRYGNALKQVGLPDRLKDFAVIRGTFSEKVLLQSHEPTEMARKLCNIPNAVPDPWLHGGIGINRDNRLTFAVPFGDGMSCFVDNKGRYESVRVVVAPDASTKNKNPYEFPSPALELKRMDGSVELRRPYEY